MQGRPVGANRNAQLIRLPGKVRSLSREEIERLYPDRSIVKGSLLTTVYTCPKKKGPGQVFIYGLADPRDHVIRYVGKTSLELSARLDSHLKFPTSVGMGKWLGFLSSIGVRPEIVALEICPTLKWEDAERAWIKRMRKLGELLNVQDGGSFRVLCT